MSDAQLARVTKLLVELKAQGMTAEEAFAFILRQAAERRKKVQADDSNMVPPRRVWGTKPLPE
ncbi:hypothetical protein GCM10028796_54960 [Ramlibacter monticola]|uniref:Uncharacterized protein n=1 Tax=Ramlibacter monticola TaxID=1926872 RepID=A0A936Z4B8_9BURK|nr:hypothetical protein [Ramlibacter monticola]MBL0394880.1 hypothetical protein [Ramlibacter monticola]